MRVSDFLGRFFFSVLESARAFVYAEKKWRGGDEWRRPPVCRGREGGGRKAFLLKGELLRFVVTLSFTFSEEIALRFDLVVPSVCV